MAKKADKTKDVGLYFTKERFFIVCIIVLLLLVAYLLGKSNSLFLGSSGVITPSPTFELPTNTPQPTNTPSPTQTQIYYAPQPTNTPIPTATPVPQRVPVMNYYGNVMYCDPSGVDIVKQAVQNVQSAESSSNACEDSVRTTYNSCLSLCTSLSTMQSCMNTCSSNETSGLSECDIDFSNALNTYKSVSSQYCN